MGGHDVEPWYYRPVYTFYVSIPYGGLRGPGLQGARRLAYGPHVTSPRVGGDRTRDMEGKGVKDKIIPLLGCSLL